MAQSFIGSLISLVSTSDIRYRGILQQIDHANSTIQLEQVYSLGTEDRRAANEFLPPNPKPYDYIVFRATEVKDLVVERRAEDLNNPALAGSVHDDPAVVGASSNVAPRQAAQPTAAAQNIPAPADVPTAAETAGQVRDHQAVPPNPLPAANGHSHTPTPRTQSQIGTVRSAEAAVESVERAMDALRVTGPSTTAQAGGRSGKALGRRGGASSTVQGPGVVPNVPFDFVQANARFEKPTIAVVTSTSSTEDSPAASPPQPAYDKKKSFFDDISSDSKARVDDNGGNRRGIARARREEERNRNLNTFGETGTVAGGHRGGGGRGRGGRRRAPARSVVQ